MKHKGIVAPNTGKIQSWLFQLFYSYLQNTRDVCLNETGVNQHLRLLPKRARFLPRSLGERTTVIFTKSYISPSSGLKVNFVPLHVTNRAQHSLPTVGLVVAGFWTTRHYHQIEQMDITGQHTPAPSREVQLQNDPKSVSRLLEGRPHKARVA